MVILGKLQPEFIQRINGVINACDALSASGNEDMALPEDVLNPLYHLISLYSITGSFSHSMRGLLGLNGMVLRMNVLLSHALTHLLFPKRYGYCHTTRS